MTKSVSQVQFHGLASLEVQVVVLLHPISDAVTIRYHVVVETAAIMSDFTFGFVPFALFGWLGTSSTRWWCMATQKREPDLARSR